ncbi:MAG: TonB-dependent receptor [Hyphomonadaceae bacterium]
MGKRSLALLVAAAACFSAPALAQQRAAENATRSADDAFGVSFGNEKIGLYNERDARGFSPLAASNVRIEGMFFDYRNFMPSRVVSSITIRVGLTAQSYPFPAPTGIADYALRPFQTRNSFSTYLGASTDGVYQLEADWQRVVVPGKFGLSGGFKYSSDDQQIPFSRSNNRMVGIVSRWRPVEDSEYTAFFGWGTNMKTKFTPLVFTSGPFVPPPIEVKFFGQDWTAVDITSRVVGVLGRQKLSDNWTMRAGLFHHSTNGQGTVADLYLNTDQAGMPTTHRVTNELPQDQPSTTGEARLTGVFEGENLRQTLHFTVRGRDNDRTFGGTASASITPIPVGQRVLLPEPVWANGAPSTDAVRQWAAGAQYQLAWRGLGEASIGVQHVDYEKTVTPPAAAATVTRDKPLFVNGSLVWTASKKLSAYASFTQGLEEVALAPENAVNSFEAPPAIHTEQYDVGVRYAVTPRLALVLGYFNVEKPYFNLDASRLYRQLGDETHKGFEISLAGALTDRLNVVAGAVLQKPEVTGEAVTLGLIGPKPVSQPETNLRLNLDYRTPWIEGLSLDIGVTYTGERPATSRTFAELGGKQLDAEAFNMVDIGMRQRFKIGGHTSTFRAQVLNVFDDFAWRVYPSGGFYIGGARKFQMSLATDF